MKCLIALGAMALLAKSVFATIITDPVGDAFLPYSQWKSC
jgi:hypothetical protein